MKGRLARLRGGRGRLAGLLLPAAVLACAGEETPVAVTATPPSPSRLLVDVTETSGVDFVHTSGATDDRLLPETMGSGVAIFDADGDGLPDLVFADGAPLAANPAPRPLALYRNLGGWRFERVVGDGGLRVDAYAMGLAVGDVDGDGRLDLLATTVAARAGEGGDRLFLNRSEAGAPAFEDVSAAWGLRPDGGFGSSAAFFDGDGDGDLDLFSGRYVEWSIEGDVACSPDGEHRTYCTPEVYQGAISRFYRNEGGGFVDRTEAVGITESGKSLGVVVLDADGDRRLDLAVANDTVPNQLWINRGLGPDGAGFEEQAGLAGFAVDAAGSARGGMGIASGDLDEDGHPDLVVGNFANETAGLFLGEEDVLFRETTAEARLGIPTLLSLTFGTLLVDLDGDGRLDVVLANGHIEPEIATVSNGRQSYEQPLQVFLQRGEHFVEAEVPEEGWVGRGLAAGDLDGDGDPDLVLSQNGGPAVLLRNDGVGTESADQVTWREVRLCGPGANTWGYGARVTFETTVDGAAGASGEGRRSIRRLEAAGSYLSSSEPTIPVALRKGERLSRIVAEWPSGERSELEGSGLEGDGPLVLASEDAGAACPAEAVGARDAASGS